MNKQEIALSDIFSKRKVIPLLFFGILLVYLASCNMTTMCGMSKGKGFAGIIKRHGYKSKPASHGTKHEERAMGSAGSAFPQRVLKGRKMPGRMGHQRITVKNSKIIKIDPENNLLAVKGAVPGRRGTLLEIRSGS